MDLKFSLRVHTASVTCLDLVQSLGDNKLNGNNALVSGDQSGRLVFWDLLLRRPIHQWIGHDGAIIQVGTYTLENQLFIVRFVF
ncbi:hypothetical protein BC833DRAFT_575851 [Globomyces pollinis-pini]|nr:hypothetical protein BC833DRAFT_575851 [Globomyces pollinis-pini]